MPKATKAPQTPIGIHDSPPKLRWIQHIESTAVFCERAYASAFLSKDCGWMCFQISGKKGHYEVTIHGGKNAYNIKSRGLIRFTSITAAREAAQSFDHIWSILCRTDPKIELLPTTMSEITDGTENSV